MYQATIFQESKEKRKVLFSTGEYTTKRMASIFPLTAQTNF